MIAAMASDGLVACECTTESVDSQKFFDFVGGCLIPHMHSFDGTSPKSIVILDNCSIHRVPGNQDSVCSSWNMFFSFPHIVQTITP